MTPLAAYALAAVAVSAAAVAICMARYVRRQAQEAEEHAFRARRFREAMRRQRMGGTNAMDRGGNSSLHADVERGTRP